MLLNILADDTLQILGVVEERFYCLQRVLDVIEQFLALTARLGLDAADTGSHAGLADNLEETDTTGRGGVDTTTELARRTKAHDTYLVAILLAEEGDGS